MSQPGSGRAGEAGMGFAVVADEVRNLAQRSAQAAKETAAKIEGAIGKTAQGVGMSKQVSEALNAIVAQIRQVDELVAKVAAASREQTQGITQINTAVGQMDKVTQSNAASAEESASAAEELNSQAMAMKQMVGELIALVRGVNNGNAVVRQATVQMKSNNHVNGNGRGILPKLAPAKATAKSGPDLTDVAGRQHNEIPLEGHFRDF
jgi:ABC-type transporter Mla subunit MlaD